MGSMLTGLSCWLTFSRVTPPCPNVKTHYCFLVFFFWGGGVATLWLGIGETHFRGTRNILCCSSSSFWPFFVRGMCRWALIKSGYRCCPSSLNPSSRGFTGSLKHQWQMCRKHIHGAERLRRTIMGPLDPRGPCGTRDRGYSPSISAQSASLHLISSLLLTDLPLPGSQEGCTYGQRVRDGVRG